MWLSAQLVLTLIELHGPTGQVLEINPALVSSLRQPIDTQRQHWGQGTHCVVVMSNGGFIAVAEDCPTVLDKLQR
jgi:hypothetical protein